MVCNRILLSAALAGLAVSLAGCQPVGYGGVGYVAPVYAGGYYGGYAAPVYAGGYYGGAYRRGVYYRGYGHGGYYRHGGYWRR